MLWSMLVLSAISTAYSLPSAKTEFETVPELNVEQYVGKWYQIYGNRNNWSRYTPFATCITAEYAEVNDTTLRLLNANRLVTPDGELFYLRGNVFRTAEPGKLKVQFRDFNRQGDYYVLKLGPPTFGENNMYEYSVVSGARLTEDSTLFVMTRDVARFKALYEAEVLQFLEETGFTDYWTEPIETYHGDDCMYVDIDDPDIP